MDSEFERRRNRESPLKKAYDLVGAKTPLELSNFYTDEDQKLWLSGEWDDENRGLITNKVKETLEAIDPAELNEEEREWRSEILWFWYHHATTHAFERGDIEKAKQYVERALTHQTPDHPNKITRFLKYVVEGDESGARTWAETIAEEPEKTSVQNLLKRYFEKKRNT